MPAPAPTEPDVGQVWEVVDGQMILQFAVTRVVTCRGRRFCLVPGQAGWVEGVPRNADGTPGKYLGRLQILPV